MTNLESQEIRHAIKGIMRDPQRGEFKVNQTYFWNYTIRYDPQGNCHVDTYALHHRISRGYTEGKRKTHAKA